MKSDPHTHIFYHVDDFGVSIPQSRIIENTIVYGLCNSFSLMPNSPVLDDCVYMMQYMEGKTLPGAEHELSRLRYVVHLNFIEGHCMADPKDVPLLVDCEGKFRTTFGALLKMNYSKKVLREAARHQLKLEIAAQIASVVNVLTLERTVKEVNQPAYKTAVVPQGTALSIDSHQHTHMIPVVFEALLDVLHEQHYTVEYLRIPVDPLRPLLSTPSLWFKVRFIDLVKWGVLWTLHLQIRSRVKKLHAKTPVFFGILFTCHMTRDRVSPLLPKYKKIAARKSRDLELMFHPGAVYESELLLDPSNQELVEFYKNPLRHEEYETLCP